MSKTETVESGDPRPCLPWRTYRCAPRWTRCTLWLGHDRHDPDTMDTIDNAIANGERVIAMASPEKNTAVSGDVGRDCSGRWTGSGNPGGRPRKGDALSDAIRRKADPDELADIALTIARTSKQEAMRLQALAWLRDSGYRKPAERHELALEQTQPEVDYSHKTVEERIAKMREIETWLAVDGDVVTAGAALGEQPDGVTDDEQTADGTPRPEHAP